MEEDRGGLDFLAKIEKLDTFSPEALLEISNKLVVIIGFLEANFEKLLEAVRAVEETGGFAEGNSLGQTLKTMLDTQVQDDKKHIENLKMMQKLVFSKITQGPDGASKLKN